jgi:L-fucose isomerase
MKPKVGLITTMSLDNTWPKAVVDKVQNDHEKAYNSLTSMGFDVIKGSDTLSRTKEQMVSAGKVLREADVEAAIVYVGTWTYSNITVELSQIIDVPIMIWTDSGDGNIGIVGAAIARGALDEVGVKTKLVHGGFDDKKTLVKIEKWCVGVAAFTKLKGKTLGVGGSRCMGMYTAHVDPSEIKKKFGIDIDGWEQVSFIERAKNYPDDKAQEFLQWMKGEFGAVTAKEEAMIAQIKMYLALKEFIAEKNYDMVAVKCLPEMPEIHTTFCIAHALLNDTSDAFGPKESFVCACESDVNGALTMEILKNVSGGPTMFADFLTYYEETGMVTLCNCGSQPTDFAPSRKDVHWVHEGLQEFNWKIGGACPQYVAKSGKVTMARLGRVDGEYILLVMTGEAKEYPREKLAEVNAQQPQAYVKLDASEEDFVDNLRCNHIHLVYGDYVEELKIFCETAKIRSIVI